MWIKEIQVRNYRSIRDSTKLNLTKLFALIGKNNSGKSALIEAIQAFWNEDKDKRIKSSDFHKATESNIEIIITLTDFRGSDLEKKPAGSDGDLTIEFKCAKDLKPEYSINGKKKSSTEMRDLLPKLLVISAIRNPENETTAGSKSFLKELTVALTKVTGGAVSRPDELEARAGKDLEVEDLVTLLNKKVEQRLSQISEKATIFFRDATEDLRKSLIVRPESDVSKAVSYSTHVKDPQLGDQLPMVDILSCGTGLQSMTILCLLQTFAEMGQHDDSIMLIEEPEVYLHPELQRKMFGALRKIARGTQVIYTTHSPIMISEVWADESVRLVKREDGESVFSQIDLQGVISELGIRYEDVLNPKVVVFVEGDTDACVLSRIATALRPELASSAVPKIKFVPTDGFRQIQTFALMKILHSDSVTSEFFVVGDPDGYEAKERAESLYRQIIEKVPEAAGKSPSLRERILILDAHELEAYFLNAEFLSKIVPGIPQDALQTFVDAYAETYRKNREIYLRTKSKNDRQRLVHLFKPSLVFGELKNAEHREAFKKAHNASDSFMGIRDQIAQAFAEIKKQKDPYLVMLDRVDIGTDPHLKELVALVRSMLESLASAVPDTGSGSMSEASAIESN